VTAHPTGLLDTSTVILLPRLRDPGGLPDAPLISAITLAELSVGPLVATTETERATRLAHLQQAEADFEPLPFDADAARAFGQVAASLRRTGRRTSARACDAMIAAEVRQGLETLGIVHETTLPYSPYQNAKQEVFWAQVEGRLLAMLEGEPELTLDRLNVATQAWVELEYHRTVHSELGVSPLARYLAGPEVGRPSPSSEELRRAFRAEVDRTQRHSDGTVSVEGRRFEIPARYRQLTRLRVRYARWDLGAVDLVDPHTGARLCALYPLDKAANADGQRRRLEPASPAPLEAAASASTIAPLLRKLMADYAATGLPPAYLPPPDASPDEEDLRA